ncbi:MAG: chorismate mutase [Actinomycetota bacterium]|nr:chorismate mutase [Actinomycetota bacterium]
MTAAVAAPALALATSQPAQPAPGDDLDTLVAALRSRIDAVDRSVLDLIAERRVLSRRIQDARVAAGGVRIELSREREVLDVYGRALGADGTALATAVLRNCRGRL